MKKGHTKATEANSTDFVWKKPWGIPSGERLEKAYIYITMHYFSHVNWVTILPFVTRYHHENDWVDYLHQDKQKMYYKYFEIVCYHGQTVHNLITYVLISINTKTYLNIGNSQVKMSCWILLTHNSKIPNAKVWMEPI